MIKLKKIIFLKSVQFLSFCFMTIAMITPVKADNPDEDFSKAIDAEEKRIKWGSN